MARYIIWACAGLFTLALAGAAAPANSGTVDEHDRVDQARKCAQLVQQGQLALKDAIALAEQHLKGTALDAKVEIKTAVEKPQQPKPAEKKPGGPNEPTAQPAGDRLMYEVTCVAGDKIHLVRIDGLEKKIVDSAEQRPPKRND